LKNAQAVLELQLQRSRGRIDLVIDAFERTRIAGGEGAAFRAYTFASDGISFGG
jgi:hypothetical protein